MYIIGLTGGIASGKSTVSAMLAELGAYIIDADKIAHEVIMPGKQAWQDIVDRFGQEILLDGEINREKLGQLVFNDNALRSWLEEVTHPRIEAEAKRQLKMAEEEEYDIAVLDVPLLFEVGWDKLVDEVWVVYVAPKVQLSRLMARNNLKEDEALTRIRAQMSLEEKAKFSDVVIDNNQDTAATSKKVLAAWCNIIKKQLKK